MNITSVVNNNFTVNLILFNLCNYNCSYCPSRLKDGSQQNISKEEYINFFTSLFEDNPEIFNYKKRKISFTGGEPGLYPGLDELLKFFKKNDFENSIVTNGSAKINFWIDIVKEIDVLCLSFHPRYGNYKHITKVINIFKENNRKISLNLLMDKDYWDRAIEAAEYFKSCDVKIVYKGILNKLGEFDYIDYTQEQINFLKNNTIKNPLDIEEDVIVSYSDGVSEYFDGQKIISNNLNHLSGYHCDVGKSSLVVKWDGEVCGGQCFSAVFGNLSKNKNLRIKLLKDGLICQKDKCNCVYDLRINKSRMPHRNEQ